MSIWDLKDKKALVLGLGMSGRSAARFLCLRGAYVHGVDRQLEKLSVYPDMQALKSLGATFQDEAIFPDLSRFDFLILSPGVSPLHPFVQAAQKDHVPIIGEIELGCRFVKNRMIGVTGTNGKTTVTLMINHILNHQGHRSHALGNVGIPFTQELLHIPSEDWIVLELSSYQIETLSRPVLDAALLLNITPDHLDRYPSMEAYAKAKTMIERSLKPQAAFYMEERAWKEYGRLLEKNNPLLYGYEPSSFIYTNLETVFRGGEKAFDLPPPLKGKRSHDLENVLAVYAVCADRGVSAEGFLEAWQSFRKPPHRIEFVLEHQGVNYYDDSKGTNLDAVIRAVQALEGPVILIAGGVDKGAPYTPWIEAFRSKVKFICAIGQAAGKIKEQLAAYFLVEVFDSLEEAVKGAERKAEKGDFVLLSPGCASFDMFKDYVHRGEEFQRIVRERKRGEKR